MLSPPCLGSNIIPALRQLSAGQGCRGWSCCRSPPSPVARCRAPAPQATGGRAGCCHFSFFGPQPAKEKRKGMTCQSCSRLYSRPFRLLQARILAGEESSLCIYLTLTARNLFCCAFITPFYNIDVPASGSLC